MKHLILIMLGCLACSCAQNWNPGSTQAGNSPLADYCTTFPTDPSCAGGGSSTLFKFVATTPSSDGVIRMNHPDPNHPQFGVGYAVIAVLNGTNQMAAGTVSFNLVASPTEISSLTVCLTSSATSSTCTGPTGTTVNISVAANQNQYVLLQAQANGTITFVPQVNAIPVSLVAPSDVTLNQSIKIPVVN